MRFFGLIIGGLLWTLASVNAETGTMGSGGIVRVTEENDKFVIPASDKHYTQGLHLSVLWPDERVPVWVRPMSWWPDFGMSEPIHKYGFRLGQDIYTPESIATNVLLTHDRPYAGWLFVGFIRENRGTIAGNIPTLDHLGVDIGVIGPYAQAEDSQIWFHGLIHVQRPKGWRHQLKNEPGLLLSFDRKLLIWDSAGPADKFHIQMLPHAGFNLGNVETSATLGLTMRFGYNFPSEFTKSSPVTWGWYAFSGIDGRAVAYNTFLDGNLYEDSHKVAKEPAVLRLRAGIALILRRVEISYTYNYLTKEFKQQDNYDAYASLNLICRF